MGKIRFPIVRLKYSLTIECRNAMLVKTLTSRPGGPGVPSGPLSPKVPCKKGKVKGIVSLSYFQK